MSKIAYHDSTMVCVYEYYTSSTCQLLVVGEFEPCLRRTAGNGL